MTAFAMTQDGHVLNGNLRRDRNNYITPVLYTDPTGELAYPGQVHGYVLKRIVAENTNLSKERWISLPPVALVPVLGRVDLVDTLTGEIFELKPKSWPTVLAEAQLKRYTEGTFLAKSLKELEIKIGTAAGHKLCGDFKEYVYDIHYEYDKNGIITYTYDINRQRVIEELEAAGQAVTEAAIAAFIAALILAGAALGLPATS